MTARIVTTLVLSLFIVSVAAAQDACTPSLGFATGSASTISLTGSGISTGAMDMSASFWSSCSGWGIPTFTTGGASGTGVIPVQVNYVGGPAPSNVPSDWCGQVSYHTSSTTGRLVDATIDLWDTSGGGQQCDPVSTLGHELGHVLGLDNASDPSCAGRIMGPGPNWSPSGVTDTECGEVDKNWFIRDTECTTCDPTDPRDGNGPCGY